MSTTVPRVRDATATAVEVRDLAHRYGDRRALDSVSFAVARGSVHGFLGPNGSGKSTLFRVLTTLLPIQSGSVQILGHDLARDLTSVRRALGVVFQSPALDRKLTVRANLRYGGHLQGLSGQVLEARIDAMLAVAGLEDRANDTVGELSGGLRRRVEVAKGLLHDPPLVVLDEPSTGLDPQARRDIWQFLRSRPGVTVLFTTHSMDEAEGADRLTVLDRGHIVAEDTPAGLKARVGDAVLEIDAPDPEALARDVRTALAVEPSVAGGTLRLRGAGAAELVAPLLQRFGDRVTRVSVGRPSLEDVFLELTGRRFSGDGEEA